uniref:XK-related protein n=1 Tax=Caenorhabditis tropicalis TaxID=1561998 RepID=A0A1I7TZY1_9PELO
MLTKTFAPITNFFNQITIFCLQLLQVLRAKTGTLWIAYCEIMWIVSQCSFWTAESIVREAFPPFVTIAGFTFTCIQLVLVFFLIQGVRTFRLAYIEVYMIGVCCRMFMFLSFFLTFLFFFIITNDDEQASSDQFFHRFLIIKMIFTCVYTLLKAYALYTAYRCYSYIAKTRRAIAHLTIFEDPKRYTLLSSFQRISHHPLVYPL